MQMLRRFIILLTLLFSAPSLAQAELRLGEWKNYGAMAEQGGVCAAFARIMELQGIIDTQTGKLWLERRKFAGAVVRQASVLEGLPAASAADIDGLVNRYAQWLLANLTSENDAQSIDPAAHASATQMIAEVCTGLYDRADKAIYSQYPDLASCSAPAQTPSDTQCLPVEAPSDDDQRKIKMLLQNNMMLSSEVSDLRGQIAEMETALAAADASAAVVSPTPSVAQPTVTSNKQSDAVNEREVAINTPTPKPEKIIPKATKPTPTKPAATAATTAATTTARSDTKDRNKFAAQLGSYRAESGAQKGILALKAEFPVVLEKAGLRVVEAKLAGGQALYRIVTGPLPRSAATDICNAMWNKKLGCLLKASN